MIVRDAEQTLASAIGGARAYVDEVVVVDTGSRDSTAELATRLGARVFHFPWCESFAAARNYSLEQARCDWIFWIDADDVLPPDTGEELRRTTERYPACDVAFNAIVEEVTRGLDGLPRLHGIAHVKLFPRRPEIRFEYRVHEQVAPSIGRLGLPILSSRLRIRHAADRSAAAQQRRHERNLRLLLLDLQDRPDDAFVLMNLGAAHLERPSGGGENEAISYLTRSIARFPHRTSTKLNARLWLARAYRRANRSQAELECLSETSKEHPDDFNALLQLGEYWSREGELERAISCYEQAIATGRVDGNVVHFVNSRAEAVVRLGKLRFRAGQPGKTEALFLQVLDQFPAAWEVRQALAELYLKLERVAELEQQVASMPSGDPQVEPIRLCLRGCAATMRGDWHRALSDLTRAQALGYRPPVLSHALATVTRALEEASSHQPSGG
jgi:glycosyltransferase involved in cell wall biosynthesis